MDYISAFLSDFIKDPAAFQWVLTTLVALVIFTFALGVMFFIAGAADPARKRLQTITGGGVTGDGRRMGREQLTKTLSKVSPYVVPKKQEEVSKVRQKLQQAGFQRVVDDVEYELPRA